MQSLQAMSTVGENLKFFRSPEAFLRLLDKIRPKPVRIIAKTKSFLNLGWSFKGPVTVVSACVYIGMWVHRPVVFCIESCKARLCWIQYFSWPCWIPRLRYNFRASYSPKTSWTLRKLDKATLQGKVCMLEIIELWKLAGGAMAYGWLRSRIKSRLHADLNLSNCHQYLWES